jgi:hypothetical protein
VSLTKAAGTGKTGPKQEHAAEHAAGHAAGREKRPERGLSRAMSATLRPFYAAPHNAITQPDRYDWYLITRWLPDLGPLGFAIVKVLRRRCYHHRETGVVRNECQMEMAELAAAVGVGRTTVFREFDRNQALAEFVVRHDHYHIGTQGARRTANVFEVSMDDPVHPDDMAEYERLVAETEAQADGPAGKGRRTRDPSVGGGGRRAPEGARSP